MKLIARSLFWASVSVLGYTFVLFPALVIVRGLFAPSRTQPSHAGQPAIDVIIAAHNEGVTIRRKLENLLATEYPPDRRVVIVASDGSDDETNSIVREFEQRGVRLLELPRGGKAKALDAAVRFSTSDILVFSDANSMFVPDALTELVLPYADPDVGGVAGNQVYRSEATENGADIGERTYWSFDRLLKDYEGRAGNAVSATGAIYSIRRELYRPIPAGVNDDFYLSLGVIQQRRRLVFSDRAIAYEPPTASLELEFRRKVRVLSRAMRCMLEMRELLNPASYGFYSVQLLSHKVLRWAVFLPVSLLAVTSLVLVRQGWMYSLAAAVQLTGHALGVAGILVHSTPMGRSPMFSIPAYFLMVNAAAATALWNLISGRRVERWSSTRHASNTDVHVSICSILDGSRR